MILDFSGEGGIKYSLKVYNNSTTNWFFYIYQRMSNQSDNDIYSLVWMASPYKIGPGSFMTFIWSIDYSFFWFDTKKLMEGVIPFIGGSISASLKSNNSTTFNIDDNTPEFLPTISGDPPCEFLIMGGRDIPNSVFSTGIGMSNSATFLQQSYSNIQQEFSPDSTFWVAASSQIQTMEALKDTISNTTMFTFPINVYSLTGTLGEDNLWIIS
jgi:hypothetical protein